MKNFRSLLLTILVFVPFFFSCSTEGILQEIIGIKAEPPVYLDCRPVSSTETVFRFSQPVKVLSFESNPHKKTESIGEGNDVKVTFAGPLEEGIKITVDLLVEDSASNTLNVIVPFRARNDRMPSIVFNELRTEYSKPKVEFVEFYVLKAGNLGAMRLFIASNSISTPVYEFPPAEVKAGEYVVLHLRTVEDGCFDETGTNLALSGGTDAQNDARDFWLPGASKLLRKTDALWIIDQDDRVIDAVLLSDSTDSKWANKDIAWAAEYLAGQKAWLPRSGSGQADGWIPGPPDAVASTGTTNTRTICRDETQSAGKRGGNWYITATSSASPGKVNNTKRFN